MSKRFPAVSRTIGIDKRMKILAFGKVGEEIPFTTG
jgi:hypothetical protein